MKEKDCDLGVDEVTDLLARTQVFTPSDLATFMANLLRVQSEDIPPIDLLEPSAGAGALAEAVLEVAARSPTVTLVERDHTLAAHLTEFCDAHGAELGESSSVLVQDFFEIAPEWIKSGRRFSHIVMNPPYARIAPGSNTAQLLGKHGVHAHNLFAAFIWLATDLLDDGGRLVAIVPRSFLSGLHYAATRRHLFEKAGLYALHHFTDRRAVFARDGIQQEVIIFGAIRAPAPAQIQFSQSASLIDAYEPTPLPTARLVLPESERHVVLVPDLGNPVSSAGPTAPLLPEGIVVSVGSVVDFRMKGDLVARSEGDIPLIGAEAFYTRDVSLRGLRANSRTAPHVYPPGRYVVVRRISPAEARPRIQAKLIQAFGSGFERGVAFENHLLVFHAHRTGIDESTCTVLLKRLSHARTEQQFMERGGTTQVNVGDIRSLRYAN